MNPANDADGLVMKAAGAALLVIALVRLPELLGSAIQSIFALGTYLAFRNDAADIVHFSMWREFLINLVSFLLLLFLARWVYTRPRFLRVFFRSDS